MFSITIAFGSTTIPLLFKSEETFSNAMTLVRTPATVAFERESLVVTDDFGHTLDIKRSAIHGVLFEDMEKSKLAQIEMALHQTRANIGAQQAGQSDPVISAHFRTRSQQPAVLSPADFNGAFRRQ